MAIFETYSKRKRRLAKQGQPDVYIYDNISDKLKVQIACIAIDALGQTGGYNHQVAGGRWKLVHEIVAREEGVFALGPTNIHQHDKICIDWLVNQQETDRVLDMVEVIFRVIERVVKADENSDLDYLQIRVTAQDAIDELNDRFKEAGAGYQYDGGNIIKIDHQYIHSEIVLPALSLTSERGLEKADEDFRLAHDHYRSKKNKDCVVAAQRAFESAMKSICKRRGWNFKPTDRASDLIKIMRTNKLFPDYLGPGFDSYIAMLKTGLPELRNNAGGHGEGPDSIAVPDYVASYALHMTATNIVFLFRAERQLQKRR